MQNPCDINFDYPDGFPVERYGVGLTSVSQVVKKYDGEMTLSAERGVFTAVVLLNLPARPT